MLQPIHMIFLGNPLWGDDGAGTYLLRRFSRLRESRGSLSRQGRPVVLIDGGTGGLNLLNAFDGAGRIEVFDAVQSGGHPGEVYRIPGRQVEFWPARSSHDFGIEQVIRLYCEISPDPLDLDDIVLYGIEVKGLEFGESLSPPVQQACDRLFNRLVEELDP
ncbi:MULTISPECIES: hydrogenase maturation protease [Kyrpidia]|nr:MULTISPECIES: hydrogenase maturation protease [Kyrpidia]MCL6577182.1 hydrogenase maturation protease [Kyrpidia sp.]CAB3391562.1 Putative hydrogenase maturation protease (HupD) [Kyrpidia spormannii]HHY65648.1 hydrogenase maturation protease [Alicyclobacillus sp.]